MVKIFKNMSSGKNDCIFFTFDTTIKVKINLSYYHLIAIFAQEDILPTIGVV